MSFPSDHACIEAEAVDHTEKLIYSIPVSRLQHPSATRKMKTALLIFNFINFESLINTSKHFACREGDNEVKKFVK